MIQITINPETQPKTYVFSKDCITIGSDAHDSDLNLPEEKLQNLHIKICAEKGQFFVINCTNDPFTSFNGKPFGKKKIRSKEILQIGKTKLHIELTSSISNDYKEDDKKNSATLDDQENSMELEESFSLNKDDEVEDLEFLSEDQENNPNSKDSKGFKIKLGKHLIAIFVGLIICCLIGFGFTYSVIKKQSEKDRLIAAEGIADVAMALAYAQVNHIKPQKQNWIDPEFLKNNLASILSSEYPSLSYIDNQGQFCNCPYLLRIYTNNDLSQFLIMAQPNPRFWQWLVSTATIVVDSQHMELRSLYDLKGLNRLLVNANTIDRANAVEIFSTVEQGELIPLASLGTSQGFTPPKALALVRPGAENRIYNAPRYYHFGESLLTKAIELFKVMNNSNHYELGRLQQQTTELSHFKNLVLYSSQGIQKALQAQKALSALAPKHNFLLAYLNFKSNGTIANSHLLFDFDRLNLTADASSTINPSNETEASDHIEEKSGHAQDHNHNPYQTLTLQLNSLAQERKKELQLISTQILNAFHEHEEGKLDNFNHQLQLLLKQYEQEDLRSYHRIVEELKDLYEEHAEIPLEELTHQLKTAGLEFIAQESLRELAEDSVEATQVTPIDVNEHIEKIVKAQSFIQLDQAVCEVAALLTLSHVPSADMIIHYQNEMRSKALKQIRMLLLSSKSPLKAADFNEENRIALANTLKTIWVNDLDEYHYYLNEFDLLKDSP